MSDTNEISKECLIHYDNRHIQVRLDFLGLCSYDRDLFQDRRKEEPNQECMAKILRILETLTNHARTDWQMKALKAKDKGLSVPQEPKEYPLELTNGVFVTLLYNTFGESTVRNSLDYLVEVGYIGRYQEKRNTTPRYWLNVQKIQALLKVQAENELSGCEIVPLNSQGVKSNTKRPKSNTKPANSNPDTPKSDPSGSESTDNNINNKDNNSQDEKQEERESPPNIPSTPPVAPDGAARADVPVTYADCLAYLSEHSVTPQGDSVEQMIQARMLYAHKHPRYEYRARPGLSEHPDDQLPGTTLGEDEQNFTLPGDTSSQVEHTHEGIEHPFTCYYEGTYYAACPLQKVDLNGRQSTFQPPLEPNEFVDQKEEPADAQNHGAVLLSGAVVTPGSPPSPACSTLVEPDMSGKWCHEKCVEYAEWCNKKRYAVKMREEQVKAAQTLHKNDTSLTLEQFKQAYDERNDTWWQEHKNGKLHVTDMKAKGQSGVVRVYEMLQRIEDTASKSRAQPRLAPVAPKPNQPITNIRELVKQREALRAAAAVTVGV